MGEGPIPGYCGVLYATEGKVEGECWVRGRERGESFEVRNRAGENGTIGKSILKI